MRKDKLPVLLAAVMLAGCSTSTTQETQTAETAETMAVTGAGLDLANLDTTVNPCQDFYQYANGGWLKQNPVPASESAWGSFNELADQNNKVLRGILVSAAQNKNASKGSAAQKVGDFYAAGMDSVAINNAGFAPIKKELDRVESISDKEDLLKMLARYQRIGVKPAFSVFVGQDEKESTRYAVYAYQGGLGLPDRDYYFNDDARSKKFREEYLKHIQKMFELTGTDAATAKKKAGKVMDLETRMARASKTRVDLRDPHANYNKMTLAQLQKNYPNLDWDMLLKEMGAKGVQDVIVGQPAFLQEVDQMVAKVPVSDWKTYLSWHLLRTAAPYLSQNFVDENFRFYGTVLTGAKEMKPRWKRVLKATDVALGEALGQLYVQKTFSPEAKKKAMEMVNNLQYAFKEHVKTLDWMSEETKKQALQKLDAFVTKIGYPDKWKDYSGLEIERDEYLSNVQRASEFAFERDLNKIGKEVDRTEWFMSPPTVNAYYNPSMNEIVFPAGILQPPFFDPNADDAVNYGGMGAVIGHELT
ncbi:MAG: M13 family metallopeptidase, partial [Hymenobacteraceae bacterium]|nr:M13 family metallopeptidase [Hymenobacteraceae bacterium]MDX5512375.1 M13 family metallopeptidase [Hymenobacteraceae bacterium]